jgi:hypothetical protein
MGAGAARHAAGAVKRLTPQDCCVLRARKYKGTTRVDFLYSPYAQLLGGAALKPRL